MPPPNYYSRRWHWFQCPSCNARHWHPPACIEVQEFAGKRSVLAQFWCSQCGRIATQVNLRGIQIVHIVCTIILVALIYQLLQVVSRALPLVEALIGAIVVGGVLSVLMPALVGRFVNRYVDSPAIRTQETSNERVN